MSDEDIIRLTMEFVIDRVVMATDDALAYSTPDIPDLVPSIPNKGREDSTHRENGAINCEEIQLEFLSTRELDEGVVTIMDEKAEINTENISCLVAATDQTIPKCEDVRRESDLPNEDAIKQFFRLPHPEMDAFYFPILSTNESYNTPCGSLSEETIVLIGGSHSSVLTFDDEISELLLNKSETIKHGACYEELGKAMELKVLGEVQNVKRTDTPFPSIFHNLRSFNDQVNVDVFSRGKCSPADVLESSFEIDFEATDKSRASGDKCETRTEDKLEEVRKSRSIHPAFNDIKNKFKKLRRACRKLFIKTYRDAKFSKMKADKVHCTPPQSRKFRPRKNFKLFDLLKCKTNYLVQKDNAPNIKLKSARHARKLTNCTKRGFGKRFSNFFSNLYKDNSKIKDGEIITQGDINVKLISHDSNKYVDSISINNRERDQNIKDIFFPMESPPEKLCIEYKLKNSLSTSEGKQVMSDNEDDILNIPRCDVVNVFASVMENHAKRDSKYFSFVLPFSNSEAFHNVQSFNQFPPSSTSDYIYNPFDLVYSNLTSCQGVNSFLNPFPQINEVDIISDQPNTSQNIDDAMLDYIVIDSFPIQVLSGDNLGHDFMPLGLSKNAKNSESMEDLDDKFANYSNNPLIESACQTIPDNIRDEIINLKEELESLKNKKKVNTLKHFFVKLKSSTSISTHAAKKMKDDEINNIDTVDRNTRKCRCIKCEKIEHDANPLGQMTYHPNDTKHGDGYIKTPQHVLTKVSSSFTKKLSKLFSKVAESVDMIKPERNVEKDNSKKALKLFKERQKLLEKMEENSLKQQMLLNRQELPNNKSAPIKKKYFSRNNRIWPFCQESSKSKPEGEAETCKVTLKLPFIDDPLSAVLLVTDKLVKGFPNQDANPCVIEQTNVLSKNYFNELQNQTPLHSCLKTPNEMLFPRDTLTKPMTEESAEEFFLNQKINKRICLINEPPQTHPATPHDVITKREERKEIEGDEMYNAIKSFLDNKPITIDKDKDSPAKENFVKKKNKKIRNKSKPRYENHLRDCFISGPQKICQPGMDKYESYCDNHYCLRNIFPFGNNSLTDQYCKRKTCKNGKVQMETFSAPSYFSASNESMSSDSHPHCCNSLTDDNFRPFSTPGWLQYNKSYGVPPSFVRQITFPTPIIRNRDVIQGTSDDWSEEDRPIHRERTSPFGRKQRIDSRQCQCCHKSTKDKCRYKHYPCHFQSYGYKASPKISFQCSTSGTSGVERNECVWFQEFPSQIPSRSRQATRFSAAKHPNVGGSRSRAHKKTLGYLPGTSTQKSNMKQSKANLRNSQTKKNKFYFQPKKHNLSFKPTCSHCNCGDQRKKCTCENNCSSR